MNDVSLSYIVFAALLLCLASLAFKFAPFWLIQSALADKTFRSVLPASLFKYFIRIQFKATLGNDCTSLARLAEFGVYPDNPSKVP